MRAVVWILKTIELLLWSGTIFSTALPKTVPWFLSFKFNLIVASVVTLLIETAISLIPLLSSKLHPTAHCESQIWPTYLFIRKPELRLLLLLSLGLTVSGLELENGFGFDLWHAGLFVVFSILLIPAGLGAIALRNIRKRL